jgi:hypothetical protein
LIAALLTMGSQSQQVMLDAFLAGLACGASLVRGVSDGAFAKADSHLHIPALESLTHWLVDHAEAAGRIARWRGLRVVAGDASVLMPAVRTGLRLRAGGGLAQ